MTKLREKNKKKKNKKLCKKDKIALKATERLLKSGIEIKDVFGHLEN